MERITVWTIGYDGRPMEPFLALLKEHKIEVIVDVRSWPTSRVEHFKQEEMKKWLSRNKVEYIWLGKELGGYRAGGYEKYVETPNFREGIEKLILIGRSKHTCICCVEKDPRYCHRRFITRELLKRGHEVVHIIEQGVAYRGLSFPSSHKIG